VTTPCRLCLITDRRRLCAAAGAPLETWRSLLTRQVAGAIAAGVDFVQVRERDLNTRELKALTADLASMTRGTHTRLLVNDRIDVALAADAGGVHLREDSVAPLAVRAIVPAGWIVGRSVHGPAGLENAAGADFVVAGTVFSTPSKPAVSTLLGLEGLSEVVRAAGPLAVFAIGGVIEANAGAVKRAGASGLASIGAFLPERPDDDPARSVQERTALLRLAFEQPGSRDLS
jgi:thiamine-phosphate pyrophosphorylase